MVEKVFFCAIAVQKTCADLRPCICVSGDLLLVQNACFKL